MTTPRSPRGRKAKGDLGERQAKAILEAYGLKVLDGRMTEPGCDLILNPQAVVEVKNCPWASIGGTDRKSLLAAAEIHRARGIAHWVITFESDGPKLGWIDRGPTGKIGLVYRQPLDWPGARLNPLPPGFPKALGTVATHAERAGGSTERHPTGNEAKGPGLSRTTARDEPSLPSPPAPAKRIFSQDAFDALEREVG